MKTSFTEEVLCAVVAECRAYVHRKIGLGDEDHEWRCERAARALAVHRVRQWAKRRYGQNVSPLAPEVLSLGCMEFFAAFHRACRVAANPSEKARSNSQSRPQPESSNTSVSQS